MAGSQSIFSLGSFGVRLDALTFQTISGQAGEGGAESNLNKNLPVEVRRDFNSRPGAIRPN
jgi:hypothetical protein